MAADINSNGLMRLPHFTSSKVAMDLDEPIYQNLFTVSLTPPAGLGTQDEMNIILEGLKGVGQMPGNPGMGTVAQKYKWAGRLFAGGSPTKDGTGSFNLAFQLNLKTHDNTNDNYTYKFLRKWHDLVYDPLTGRTGIKRDYAAGEMTVTVQDRRGLPYWQWIFRNVWPSGELAGPNLSYDQSGILEANCTFSYDYHDETTL